MYNVCWMECRLAFSPTCLFVWVPMFSAQIANSAWQPCLGKKKDDNYMHTGPSEHMYTQNTYWHWMPTGPDLAGHGWHCPLPHNLLSSSGTISVEHCAWSRHIPGPRRPEDLFFPHWLERRAHSKEKAFIFRTLKYMTNN